jgi:putative spermidine/putrescine transport system substrate-binding protein
VLNFDRAIAADPREPNFHNNRGAAMADLGQYKIAERSYREAIRLKPNLAAVAANPGALAALFQQGQIDIRPGNFNAIQILKARGVPVEFVAPKEGAIAFKTSIHIVKNSPNKALAAQLIDVALSPEVQTRLMQAPYLVVPTNSKVKMEGEIATVLAKDTAELKKKFVFQDWKKINENRAEWIDRFNKEIKV